MGTRCKGDRFEPVASLRVLPRDRWIGATFIEADGSEMQSIWDGRAPLTQSKWPERSAAFATDRTIARRHVLSR